MTTMLPAPASTTPVDDPIGVAIRLRPPQRDGLPERFAATDRPPGADLTLRYPLLARALRSRKFQFLVVLPNELLFWTVVAAGLAGTVVPGLNFATAVTWYLWFA